MISKPTSYPRTPHSKSNDKRATTKETSYDFPNEGEGHCAFTFLYFSVLVLMRGGQGGVGMGWGDGEDGMG